MTYLSIPSAHLPHEGVSSDQGLIVHPRVTDEQDRAHRGGDVRGALRVVRPQPEDGHAQALVRELR